MTYGLVTSYTPAVDLGKLGVWCRQHGIPTFTFATNMRPPGQLVDVTLWSFIGAVFNVFFLGNPEQ